MNKVITGSGSAVLMGLLLLRSVSAQSPQHETWILDKISFVSLLDVYLPRVFVLGIAGIGVVSGLGVMLSGFGDLLAVHGFARQFKGGRSAVQVLASDAAATSWTSESHQIVAHALLAGQRYQATIAALMHSGSMSLDQAVLTYKAVVDHLATRCELIDRAARWTGVAAPLPRFVLPAVRVVEAPQRSLTDLLTKVDLSASGNSGVLSIGDLIYSYNQVLVENLAQLGQLAARTQPSSSASLGVVRLIKTSNNHPLMGIADEFAWQALHLECPGGPLAGHFE